MQVISNFLRIVLFAFVLRSQNWKYGIFVDTKFFRSPFRYDPLSASEISLNHWFPILSLSKVIIEVKAPGLEGVGASSPVRQVAVEQIQSKVTKVKS